MLAAMVETAATPGLIGLATISEAL